MITSPSVSAARRRLFRSGRSSWRAHSRGTPARHSTFLKASHSPTSTASPVANGIAPSGAQGQPPAAAPAKPVPAQLPEVVARVNGEDVKKVDLERMIHTMEGRAGQPVPPDHRDEIYRGALDQLIVYTLLSQESKTRGIKVDDAEIEAKMKQLRDQFPTQDAFDKALKERGM